MSVIGQFRISSLFTYSFLFYCLNRNQSYVICFRECGCFTMEINILNYINIHLKLHNASHLTMARKNTMRKMRLVKKRTRRRMGTTAKLSGGEPY